MTTWKGILNNNKLSWFSNGCGTIWTYSVGWLVGLFAHSFKYFCVCGSFFARDLIWILLYRLGAIHFFAWHYVYDYFLIAFRIIMDKHVQILWATTRISKWTMAYGGGEYEIHHITSTWFRIASVVYVIHMMLLIHQEEKWSNSFAENLSNTINTDFYTLPHRISIKLDAINKQHNWLHL